MTTQIPTQTDALNAALPDGYSQRPATLDDAEAAARLYSAAYHARGENETFTAQYMVTDWNEPRFNLATDSQVFFDPHGEMVGCITVWDKINPAHPWLDWEVMPRDDWTQVAQAVLGWGEQRALQAIAQCQPDERFAPVSGADAESAEQMAFFEARGYRPVRYFYRMGITMTEPPAVLPLPQGFTLRTMDYPSELEAVVKAKDDAWHDHYGYVARPLDELVAEWRHSLDTDDKFDPSLWYLAVDEASGAIAGLVLCRIEDHTNPNEGHVAIVAVGRDYRKKGLAQAMLTHAFAEYWRRGQKSVNLGVDASSPTGATRLYERVGMSPVRRFVRMEKEMRPGVERMNTGD